MERAPAVNSIREARLLRQRLPEAALLFLVFGLCLISAITLYSIGRAYQPASMVLMLKQVTWMLVGVFAMWVATRLHLERLREFTWWIAGLCVVLMIAVLIPGIGSKINGARRWIDLGPMNMQVSDFVKIGFVFVFAHYLAVQQRRLGQVVIGYLLPIGMVGTVFVFLMAQPDYGTAALFGAVGAILLFLSGARLLYLIPTGLVAVSGFAVMILYNPERLSRILAYLDLQAHRESEGYQLWQGIVAFGAGGIGGVGIGQGRQPLTFLPEAHTDFIFAVIAEEMGLVFTAAIVAAFVGFFSIVVYELRKSRNLFEFLIVMGSLLFIVLQAMINLGVVTGLLPTKGMSLPFVSYGGSNLVAMFFFVGLIINCLREWNAEIRTKAREIHV
jgi:cell division protein FtsW